MIIVGLDPGLSGGIAVIGKTLIKTVVMPVRGTGKKGAHEIDWLSVADFINSLEHSKVAFIERVASRPGQGVASMFKFGGCYEGLRAVCETLKVPYNLVTPQSWQKKMLEGSPKEDLKESAYAVARRFWPEHNFLATERCKKFHSGMVDAALIAEYGKRLLAGEIK